MYPINHVWPYFTKLGSLYRQYLDVQRDPSNSGIGTRNSQAFYGVFDVVIKQTFVNRSKISLLKGLSAITSRDPL